MCKDQIPNIKCFYTVTFVQQLSVTYFSFWDKQDSRYWGKSFMLFYFLIHVCVCNLIRYSNGNLNHRYWGKSFMLFYFLVHACVCSCLIGHSKVNLLLKYNSPTDTIHISNLHILHWNICNQSSHQNWSFLASVFLPDASRSAWRGLGSGSMQEV